MPFRLNEIYDFAKLALTLTAALALMPGDFSTANAAENLIAGGRFEQGLSGWSRFWSRTGEGEAQVDSAVRREGRPTLRVEHRGQQDWSLAQLKRLDAKPGQVYQWSAWVRLEGPGEANVSVTLYDSRGQALDWIFGAQSTKATSQWRNLRGRFLTPEGTAAILPRLTGRGPATVWFDDVQLTPAGSLDAMRPKDLPKRLSLSNASLELAFDTADASFSLSDRRAGRLWRQRPGASVAVLEARLVTEGASPATSLPSQLMLRLLEPANMLELTCRIRLEPQAAEAVVELQGNGAMDGAIAWPAPVLSEKGMFLAMPVNEGISYPVDDASLPTMRYHLYGGHGLCMGWYGVTDGRQGLLWMVETPDDAAVRVPRIDGRLCLAPEWLPQKGQFGAARRIRYVLLDDGGYVAMCRRYRAYARQNGILKTLAEKRKENPNVDLLVGAANVWAFGQDGPKLYREMRELGIERVLWSNRQKPEQIQALNELGALTSRYDIYQDLMDPAVLPMLRGLHSDWTQDAWPHDITLGPDGKWIPGWGVKGKDGKMYSCAVLCDSRAPAYAQRRVPAELKTHPYRCRFIDTTTAAPWYECYHPDHPQTRSDSKRNKMALLEFISKDCGLVTGSETGHEAAVPYVHYFEGMLSLGPYRVRDAGRNMLEVLEEVPEQVARFQTGHFYRLPLWELVYHDCVVAQWYWGDYNNKLPAVWQRRDLFNALYGTPPMFLFDAKGWKANRDRFVRSYRTATPVARATGYSEMLSHRWLSDDHAVQESRFANGVVVRVNFGAEPCVLPDGKRLEPMSLEIKGISP